MALLGSNVDPRLFLQDFSGVVDASRTTANSIANTAKGMAQSVNDYTKEQKDSKALLKASQAQIEYAMTLFPDQSEQLKRVSVELKNEENPLSERVAVASGIAEMINMGVGQKRYEDSESWKQKSYQLEQGDQGLRQQEASTRDSIAQLQIKNAQYTLDQEQADQESKAAMGPGLLDGVMSQLDKSSPDLAKSIRDASKGLGDEQKYDVAQKSSIWLPKAADVKAPPTMDVAVRNGTQKMEMGADGVWRPIRVDMQPFGTADSELMLPPDIVYDQDGNAIEPAIEPGMVLPPLEPAQGVAVDTLTVPRAGFTPTKVNTEELRRVAKEGREINKEAREKAEFEQKTQGTQVAKQNSLAKMDEFDSSLGRLAGHPGFNGLFGVGVGARHIAGTDASDANTLFNQIEGQAFLAAIPSLTGMGALSDAEGSRITSAFMGMKTGMSESAARTQIGIIKEVLAGSKKRLEATISAQKMLAPNTPISKDDRMRSIADGMFNELEKNTAPDGR